MTMAMGYYHLVSIALVATHTATWGREGYKGAQMTRITSIALIALVVAFPARANLYKCVGANGAITYSDVQCKTSAPPAIEAPPTAATTVPANTSANERSASGTARKPERTASSDLPQDPTQTEMQVRAEISASVSKAFLQRDFDLLEVRSKEYRVTKSRTPSGIWKLTTLYVAIGDAISRTTNNNPNNFGLVEGIADEWVSKYPNSPTAHIVKGLVYYYRGYSYRGSGFSKTVDQSAWKPYYELVATAKSYLEESKSIASVDPAWYELMLMIGRAEGWKRAQFQATLDEALKREPLFYQTYFAALEYFLPKWGGSIEEVEQLARAAMKRTEKVEGKGLYARVYWYASQTQFQARLFMDSQVEWKTMRQGFDDVIAKYPDAWNLNNYAKFACIAQDAAKLNQLFNQIGADFVEEAWPSPVIINMCQNIARRSN